MDGPGPDLAARQRTLRSVRPRAEADPANVDPGLSASASGARPLDAQRTAGWYDADLWRVVRLPARDGRRARLQHGRQLRADPLAAVGQAPAADVEDLRAAADHRPLDPARPRPWSPLRRG